MNNVKDRTIPLLYMTLLVVFAAGGMSTITGTVKEIITHTSTCQ